MRLTYDLYAALREDKIGSLRALVGGVPLGKRLLSVYMVAGRIVRDLTDEQDEGKGANLSAHEGVVRRAAGSFGLDSQPVDAPTPSPLRPLTEDECRHWARTLLAAQLNRAESKTRRQWTPRDQVLPQAWARGEPDGTKPSKDVGLVWSCHFEGLSAGIYLLIGQLAQRSIALRQCPGCQRLFYSRRGNHKYCDTDCGDAARQRDYYRNKPAKKAKRPRRRRRGTSQTPG